ncbi:tRNA (N(6)-L-threonylcarbamoyladenosine(37)-C(2))-methylthiotransferase MtaB [Enterocloster citroniae]
MPKAALHNLGCKVNAYEAEAMQQQLEEHGYEIVPFDQKADVYIINTCSVTNVADKKSRQMLHQAKRMNPDSVVVAAGCYVQVAADILEKDGCVDVIIGNNQKAQLARILDGYLEGREDSKAHVLDIDHTNEYESMRVSRISGHSRAFIKVQDGCNQFCSYCIIPYARGRVRSRNPEDVVEEVKGLVAQGYKEVVLTGIHLSSYGIEHLSDGPVQGGDWDHTALLDLILRIHEIPGLERIRLGSLEPRIITVEFAGILAGLSKFCPHFHLSLQSGCSETLKRMNRHYTTQDYMERCNILRSCFDHPAITTDVIVGFPGETQEEFTATREFLEQVHFFEMHVFKYSRRGGTRAADMPDQVPEPVKAARSDVLLDLEAAMSKEYREWFIGGQVSVLFEEMVEVEGNMYMVGHTPQYVKAALAVNGPEGDGLQGTIHTLKAVGLLGNDLLQVAFP